MLLEPAVAHYGFTSTASAGVEGSLGAFRSELLALPLERRLERAVREGEAGAVGALDGAAERASEEARVVLGQQREQHASFVELQLRLLDASPRHLQRAGRSAGSWP